MIIGATCIINDAFKSNNDGRFKHLETFTVLKVSGNEKFYKTIEFMNMSLQSTYLFSESRKVLLCGFNTAKMIF